ncbi:MAG: hypothetical protein AB8H86_17085 [Polyangiales bacterium]
MSSETYWPNRHSAFAVDAERTRGLGDVVQLSYQLASESLRRRAWDGWGPQEQLRPLVTFDPSLEGLFLKAEPWPPFKRDYTDEFPAAFASYEEAHYARFVDEMFEAGEPPEALTVKALGLLREIAPSEGPLHKLALLLEKRAWTHPKMLAYLVPRLTRLAHLTVLRAPWVVRWQDQSRVELIVRAGCCASAGNRSMADELFELVSVDPLDICIGPGAKDLGIGGTLLNGGFGKPIRDADLIEWAELKSCREYILKQRVSTCDIDAHLSNDDSDWDSMSDGERKLRVQNEHESHAARIEAFAAHLDAAHARGDAVISFWTDES